MKLDHNITEADQKNVMRIKEECTGKLKLALKGA